MLANTRLRRTFIFEHEVTLKVQRIEMSLEEQILQMNDIVQKWKLENLIDKNLEIQFKIYDPQINFFVDFSANNTLTSRYLRFPVIKFKYKELNKSNCMESKGGKQSQLIKSCYSRKDRKKQRTIKQVLEYVKQWRQIHKTSDNQKKKINLQVAAKMIGLSKKSLDDYYGQLRLAEAYGFNFQENIQGKIGILRTFVKQKKSKESKSTRCANYQKLPKNLKIIQTLRQTSTSKITVTKNKQEQSNTRPIYNLVEPLHLSLQNDQETPFSFSLISSTTSFIIKCHPDMTVSSQEHDFWFS